MIITRPEDVIHKIQILRLLTEICDSKILAQNLYFKGGTCASMLGYLDRFSIDLDFDLKKGANKKKLREEFVSLFKNLDFSLDYENPNFLQFILKYQATPNRRSTLKVSVSDSFIKSSVYQPFYLSEVDRFFVCQTIETMFANKLVAPIDRFEKHEKIAGRDIYDIHHFFLNGYLFRKEIIEERMKMDLESFIKRLIDFIERHVTETTINEDLNTLLPEEKFQKIRKVLKPETLVLLKSLLIRPSVI